MLDVTEATGTRANVTQYQESGSSTVPAFAHVRTKGFLANGVKGLHFYQFLKTILCWRLDVVQWNPIRAAERCCIDLLGVNPITGGLAGHGILLALYFSHLCYTADMLNLVATPIGNLGDITLRALETLKQADYVVSEDTRKTGFLLHHFGIKKPQISFREDNEKGNYPI